MKKQITGSNIEVLDNYIKGKRLYEQYKSVIEDDYEDGNQIFSWPWGEFLSFVGFTLFIISMILVVHGFIDHSDYFVNDVNNKCITYEK